MKFPATLWPGWVGVGVQKARCATVQRPARFCPTRLSILFLGGALHLAANPFFSCNTFSRSSANMILRVHLRTRRDWALGGISVLGYRQSGGKLLRTVESMDLQLSPRTDKEGKLKDGKNCFSINVLNLRQFMECNCFLLDLQVHS